MFPYPSGAGLHVGHPLGYIASDIYSRFKRLKGFNVLHPMGYDAYGLPAEQYAIQTGQHPAITTEENITRYREQLDKIGFSFDWDREVHTCDPKYYKWTQWTFIRLFNAWFNVKSQKAENIETLFAIFEKEGNANAEASTDYTETFTAGEWNSCSEEAKLKILMNYRLAYLADTMVNWCPELGTVLANDEVTNGLSVRGAHPVERKVMRNWALRISSYADRLLKGLETLDWSDSLKEIQRNWIGRSEGSALHFAIKGHDASMEIFTTRPDTIFGATFMVLAPEHELVAQITTPEAKEDIDAYVAWAKNRSERERMSEVKKVSGAFTGAYCINPFNGAEIQIWIADYVLMGYGTGAIMAVPGHDSRDFSFARFYNLPIVQVVNRPGETPTDPSTWEESFDSKEGTLINSDFITGMSVKDGIKAIIKKAEELGIGHGTVNFRLRDATFSRQRYWGEPFPVFYKDGMPFMLEEDQLPLELPEIDKYLPTETGEPPLARARKWKTKEGYPLEVNTMPGFAGSSGYYLRYMDPNNDTEYFSHKAVTYWQNVDLYIGGAEHATGHLIYSRFWNKFLFDMGLAVCEEPFKKLINQGMIQGRSSFAYRANLEKMAKHFIQKVLKDKIIKEEFPSPIKGDKRIFDLFFPDDNLIIEINNNKIPKEIEQKYMKHADENGFELLILPYFTLDFFNSFDFIKLDFINTSEGLIGRIKAALDKKDITKFDKNNSLSNVPVFVSKNTPEREKYSDTIHVDINFVHNDILDIEAIRKWQPQYENAIFHFEDGKYVCGWEVEKMSKSKYNVQNPDDLIEKYGADTLRMYEMFLGPLEQSKPWDTNGIEGVFRFIRKFWKLFHDFDNNFSVSDAEATPDELKVLHRTIKKVQEDIERFSFNTAVSAFMICVNELTDLKCNKRAILEPLVILLSSYAPHIAEELWKMLGHTESITFATFPDFNEAFMVENTCTYAISFNGKLRFTMNLPADLSAAEVEKTVLSSPDAQRYLEGKTPKKVIVVPKKIVNIVLG
jgi:leucyl-tRNA synthetase